MLMNSRGQIYRRVRMPSTISWTKCVNYNVRLYHILHDSNGFPGCRVWCIVDNSHTFPVIQRYFVAKISEEICLTAARIVPPNIWNTPFTSGNVTLWQVHLQILRHPMKGCPHHAAIQMQVEPPREPALASLYVKMALEEKAQHQTGDFWEVRRPEIQSTLWREEILRTMWLTNKDFKAQEPHFEKCPTPQTFSCWKIKFKTEVSSCAKFPTETVLWTK